ncbi:hypothetical protein E4U59_003257 [Claviceps monticola]|nr:hypothetical protein E4U59_003257 [Claviceps monticola]
MTGTAAPHKHRKLFHGQRSSRQALKLEIRNVGEHLEDVVDKTKMKSRLQLATPSTLHHSQPLSTSSQDQT